MIKIEHASLSRNNLFRIFNQGGCDLINYSLLSTKHCLSIGNLRYNGKLDFVVYYNLDAPISSHLSDTIKRKEFSRVNNI